jgi:phosphate uptake regulator/aminoglycoside phosphotransferase
MRLPTIVRDNLFFLLAETSSQIANLKILLDTSSATVAQRILDRHGYSYNLKMRIHDSCTEILRKGKKHDVDIFSLRAAENIASDLENLTDICHDCVRLAFKLTRKNSVRKYPILELLDKVEEGLSIIESSIEENNSQLAVKIGNIERKLDRTYHKLFGQQLKKLKTLKHPQDAVTSLFIAQRIEEMGDVLEDIAESIMSARLGQPMHLDRFRSLKMALSDLGLLEAGVEQIAETRSGSGISGISSGDKEEGYAAILKDGNREKLKEERESVESWHDIFPGLAPQILNYSKRGKKASLLIEHLPGQTFEQILLQEDRSCLDKTLKHLTQTLKAVWNETRRKRAIPANHMHQLRKRLSSVIDIHPEFGPGKANVCGERISSLAELIHGAEKVESELSPAFSVYIHGDFNVDNIIFDIDAGKIRFIDLHRSCYQDYVQDIAVFMVSNYRLQVLDKATRQKIAYVANYIYKFAANYARKNNDKSFNIRLALGLARSFITSTRFILDRTLAKNMFYRGVYLLEAIGRCDAGNHEKFELRVKELFA